MTRDELETQLLTKHGIRKIMYFVYILQCINLCNVDDIHIVFGHMETSETPATVPSFPSCPCAPMCRKENSEISKTN